MSRRYVTLTLAWGQDDDPEPERDSQLDTLVEHGDHYPTRPELHIGFHCHACNGWHLTSMERR